MPHKNTLELIGSTTCPYVQRVRIALIEKELPHEFIAIDLNNKPSWLKEISPYEKVPVLKQDSLCLYESTVINEYLDEVFPNPALMPNVPHLRAQARIWINFFENQLIPHYYKMLLSQEDSQQELFREKLLKNLIFMELHGFAIFSQKGSFWFGEQLTLVDIALYPFFERFPALAHYRDIEIPKECLQLRKWLAAMKQRPAVLQSGNPVETYIKTFAKYADNSATSISANEFRSK